MSRHALILALAIAATLCVSGAATAAPPEGSLQLTAVGAGDMQTGPTSFTFTERVYQRGQLVGSDRGVCSFFGRFENPRCRITLSLPQGKLFLILRLTPDPRGHFKVTSGTGAYRGKTGVGIYRFIGTDSTRIVIWLT
jgi:hypothetical protein